MTYFFFFTEWARNYSTVVLSTQPNLPQVTYSNENLMEHACIILIEAFKTQKQKKTCQQQPI